MCPWTLQIVTNEVAVPIDRIVEKVGIPFCRILIASASIHNYFAVAGIVQQKL